MWVLCMCSLYELIYGLGSRLNGFGAFEAYLFKAIFELIELSAS